MKSMRILDLLREILNIFKQNFARPQKDNYQKRKVKTMENVSNLLKNGRSSIEFDKNI